MVAKGKILGKALVRLVVLRVQETVETWEVER